MADSKDKSDPPDKGGEEAKPASAAERVGQPKPVSAAERAKNVKAELKREADEIAGRAPPKPKPKPEPEPEGPPQPPPWYKTLRADPPAHIRTLLGVGFIVLLFFVWWIVTRGAPTERIISPSKLPSPGEV
ncbi:MAG TPA: hypothetical protein VIV11_36735, partial [Kofleriaceae bacterium]